MGASWNLNIFNFLNLFSFLAFLGALTVLAFLAFLDFVGIFMYHCKLSVERKCAGRSCSMAEPIAVQN